METIRQGGYRYEIERTEREIIIRCYEDPPKSPRAKAMHTVGTLTRIFRSDQEEAAAIPLACEQTRKELLEWLDLEMGRKKPPDAAGGHDGE